MAKDEIARFKVVVIGGSAGSLEVILDIIGALPANPNAVFIIIVHHRNDNDSILESLISYKTQLLVREVEDKEPLCLNTVYLAPANYHLLIEDEHSFSLDSSERIHFSRPSIDVSFESVADVFRERVIAVLLSGANADGAEGLVTVKQSGGYSIVQDPATAEVDYMPKEAIKLAIPSAILPPGMIAQRIIERCG